MISRLQLETLVEHGTFDLLDPGGRRPPLPDLTDLTEWLHVADNGVVIASAGNVDHFASVTLETWSAEPPPEPESQWESIRNARLRLDSGELEINPLVEGDATELLRIGPPGTYRLRACARGSIDIAGVRPTPEDGGLPHGIEIFLFQFWPAALRKLGDALG